MIPRGAVTGITPSPLHCAPAGHQPTEPPAQLTSLWLSKWKDQAATTVVAAAAAVAAVVVVIVVVVAMLVVLVTVVVAVVVAAAVAAAAVVAVAVAVAVVVALGPLPYYCHCLTHYFMLCSSCLLRSLSYNWFWVLLLPSPHTHSIDNLYTFVRCGYWCIVATLLYPCYHCSSIYASLYWYLDTVHCRDRCRLTRHPRTSRW